MTARRKNPAIIKINDTIMIGRAPCLSMRRPAKGARMPIKADRVNEMLICVRDQPNSSSSGMMNKPKAN